MYTRHKTKANKTKHNTILDKWTSIMSFPHSWLITGLVTRLTRVSLVEQELRILPEHMSSTSVFGGGRVTWSLALYACFVDCCLSFCPFSFGRCYLFFVDRRILITPLVSSTSSLLVANQDGHHVMTYAIFLLQCKIGMLPQVTDLCLCRHSSFSIIHVD